MKVKKAEETGLFQQIFDSVMNPGAYTLYRRQNAGRVLAYLLLLTVLFGTISVMKTANRLDREMKTMITGFSSKSPGFIFKNGRFNFHGKMPYVQISDSGEAVIIDTTDRSGESVLRKYRKGVFVTGTRIYYKKSDAEMRVYDLSNFRQFSFDKNDMEKLLSHYRVITVLFVVLGITGSFIGKLAAALVLGFIAVIISGLVKVKMDFPELYAISAHAITLPVIADTARLFINFKIPHFWLIYYGIGAVYVWKALSLIRLERNNA